MHPVNQTKFGNKGNCVQACMASLFNVAIDGIPIFNENKAHGWYWALQEWTMENFGLYPVTLRVDNGHTAIVEGYYCVSGLSPRGLNHMCIARKGEIVHDPHPEGNGNIAINEITIFAKVIK